MKAGRRLFAGMFVAASLIAASRARPTRSSPPADPENTIFLNTKDGRVTIRLRPDLAPNMSRRSRR